MKGLEIEFSIAICIGNIICYVFGLITSKKRKDVNKNDKNMGILRVFLDYFKDDLGI